MTAPVLVLTDAPTDSDHAVVASGLAAYNEQKTRYRD